jgi:hypothetical protein
LNARLKLGVPDDLIQTETEEGHALFTPLRTRASSESTGSAKQFGRRLPYGGVPVAGCDFDTALWRDHVRLDRPAFCEPCDGGVDSLQHERRERALDGMTE